MSGRTQPAPVFRVGLTGGIASGKSAVAARFAALGIPVIDTDKIAHEIVAPGQPGLAAVVQAFGSDILSPDGKLDRKKLRNQVFIDPDLRAELEALLHPLILADMEKRSREAGGPYQILVIPLLIESGAGQQVDRVLVVDSPEPVQIRRLIARDGETPGSARRMLDSQASRAVRLAAADDRILNTGSFEDLDRAVAALDDRYRQLAAQRKNA